jgi:hypothetical protein
MGEDFVYEDESEEEDEDEEMSIERDNENIQINEENGKDLIKRNLNIIINKSVLFQKFVREEEERNSQSQKSSDKSVKKEFQFENRGNSINNIFM